MDCYTSSMSKFDAVIVRRATTTTKGTEETVALLSQTFDMHVALTAAN